MTPKTAYKHGCQNVTNRNLAEQEGTTSHVPYTMMLQFDDSSEGDHLSATKCTCNLQLLQQEAEATRRPQHLL